LRGTLTGVFTPVPLLAPGAFNASLFSLKKDLRPIIEAGVKLVLLAEDNEDDVILFKRAFKQAGITNALRIVRDGDEVIRYLKGEGEFADRVKHPFPALLLLDLNMPRANGFHVLQWVRRQSDTRDLHIIVLTTSDDIGAVKRAYDMGANSFITKSLDTGEFVGQLRDVKEHWLA
jgi:CheY-like chemotaxis protein